MKATILYLVMTWLGMASQAQEVSFFYQQGFTKTVDIGSDILKLNTFRIGVKNMSGEDVFISNISPFNQGFSVYRKKGKRYISVDSICNGKLINPIYPAEGELRVALSNGQSTDMVFTNPDLCYYTYGIGNYRIRYSFTYEFHNKYQTVYTKWFYFKVVNTKQK